MFHRPPTCRDPHGKLRGVLQLDRTPITAPPAMVAAWVACSSELCTYHDRAAGWHGCADGGHGGHGPLHIHPSRACMGFTLNSSTPPPCRLGGRTASRRSNSAGAISEREGREGVAKLLYCLFLPVCHPTPLPTRGMRSRVLLSPLSFPLSVCPALPRSLALILPWDGSSDQSDRP